MLASRICLPILLEVGARDFDASHIPGNTLDFMAHLELVYPRQWERTCAEQCAQ